MNTENFLFILVGVVLLSLVLWLWKLIKNFEAARRERLEKLKSFDAIKTDSPEANHIKKDRKKSILRMETRFSIIRRLIIPSIVLVILLIVAVPFLPSLSGNLISLLIAATTVVLGIAARPFVENLISGIVITFSRLIRIGDTVLIDDHYGTVEDISITHTTVKKWDWRRYIVPNAKMLNKEFVNYSIMDTFRWVDIEFWVSYDADLELVKKLAIEAPQKSKNFAGNETPQFWIADMTKESVHCMVVAWANTPVEGWFLSVDTRTELIRAFQEHGIKTHSFRYQSGDIPVGAPRPSSAAPSQNPTVS